MKIETFQHLIDWSRQLHQHLAHSLSTTSDKQPDQRAKWLQTYLADHETELEKMVARFEEQADPKLLDTWIFNYIASSPFDTGITYCPLYSNQSFEDICKSVFSMHNQLIELYRFLVAKADIPEAEELLKELLDMEVHETMLLAQQSNRMHDL
ncbi:ATPase [Kineobactrum sediminis]|uniref:ATPase n=1 Tax=Kineobactrum sediminis TaxID=1905677 RepID=A0A2N5Y476_9GAMM|nr:ATPase [Kineobactrum sediminis]PLW83205.1 ATPase [Kineobactrum sediminis]